MSNPRILITGAGGAAAVVLLESLRDVAELYAADIDVHAAGLYLVPEERRVLLPRGDDPAFARTLHACCRRLGIDVLIPTVDSELLPVARMRRSFEAVGVALMLAPMDVLATCLDKLELAETVPGVSVRSACFDKTFDPNAWRFPLILKPRSGSGGRGVRLVRSREELRAIPRDERLLVQQYLPGEEYSVDVLVSSKGDVVAAVPRARLKVDSGVAVAATTVHDPQLESLARWTARQVGIRGVANLQFRRDELGRPKLIEINARFPGTMSLTIAAGVDMPHLWLEETLGGEVPAGPLPFRRCAIVRTWQDHVVDSWVSTQSLSRTG